MTESNLATGRKTDITCFNNKKWATKTLSQRNIVYNDPLKWINEGRPGRLSNKDGTIFVDYNSLFIDNDLAKNLQIPFDHKHEYCVSICKC